MKTWQWIGLMAAGVFYGYTSGKAHGSWEMSPMTSEMMRPAWWKVRLG